MYLMTTRCRRRGRHRPGPGRPLRASFATGLTRSVAWRRQQLSGLARMLRHDAGALTDAMAADLGKPELEAG